MLLGRQPRRIRHTKYALRWEKMCVACFVLKISRKETTWRINYICDDNIGSNLGEKTVTLWTELFWFSVDSIIGPTFLAIWIVINCQLYVVNLVVGSVIVVVTIDIIIFAVVTSIHSWPEVRHGQFVRRLSPLYDVWHFVVFLLPAGLIFCCVGQIVWADSLMDGRWNMWGK